jgi:shikimate kinase
MQPPRNIFLVGPMGAGKSTVGRQLSRALKKRFVDSDKAIEERTGASISLIFDVEGEDGFRRREQAMIEELTALDEVVLATGGGAVLNEGNRANLMSRGFVVYLCAPVDLLVERTSRDRSRPLLQTDDLASRVEELLKERDPVYRRVADAVVQTDRRSARHVVREIQNRIGVET